MTFISGSALWMLTRIHDLLHTCTVNYWASRDERALSELYMKNLVRKVAAPERLRDFIEMTEEGAETYSWYQELEDARLLDEVRCANPLT